MLKRPNRGHTYGQVTIFVNLKCVWFMEKGCGNYETVSFSLIVNPSVHEFDKATVITKSIDWFPEDGFLFHTLNSPPENVENVISIYNTLHVPAY